MKILELREKAKKQLGEKFDLRQFHEVILINGPVPLDILEQVVDSWVKSKACSSRGSSMAASWRICARLVSVRQPPWESGGGK